MTESKDNVYYDRIGYSKVNLNIHFMDNLFCPGLKDIEFRKSYVPISFHILPDGSLFDISVHEIEDKYYSKTMKLNTKAEFQERAINIIKSSGEWIPYSFEGEYVDKLVKLVVPFYYSLEYFNELTEEIILIPDTPALFDGDNKAYDQFINNKFGCDGMVEVLFVIETDGSISHIECLSIAGKTNWQVAKAALKQLNKWKPATQNAKVVRSQKYVNLNL